jgi:hypothetical protein
MTQTQTQIEIIREITTSETEFCACCGNRIAAGTTVSLIRKAINARGRYAHAKCVANYNADVVTANEKAEREKDMIPVVRAEDLPLRHALLLALAKPVR